ncbi:MAG: SDR family oxidoreductase [Bacteroidota bacterium]
MNHPKVAVITGASSGIGKYTAIGLAKQGYEVILLVRDSEKSRQALQDIQQAAGSSAVHLIYVDLSSMASVRQAAAQIQERYAQIDLLINNAGVYKRTEEIASDGFEMTIAVNYLAPFFLTQLLLPALKQAGQARIVNLSSELYKRGKPSWDERFGLASFDGNQAYANSKLLLNFFTISLAKEVAADGISVFAVHPGVIGTDVFREFPAWFQRLLLLFIPSPEKGAKPSLYLATAEGIEAQSGSYFKKTSLQKPNSLEKDEALIAKVKQQTQILLEAVL